RHTRFSRDWSSDVCSSDLSSHQFTKNDIVVLNLKGAILKRIGGDLWVTNLSSSQITSTGEQQSLMPKSTNIAALLANAKYWGPKIGRASCRERVKISVVSG